MLDEASGKDLAFLFQIKFCDYAIVTPGHWTVVLMFSNILNRL